MPEPAVADRRPSPRPRPVDHPHLTVVPPPTQPGLNSEVPTSGTTDAAPEEIVSAGHSDQGAASEAVAPDIGFRTRAHRAWTATTAYWTPPKLFTAPPASLQELAAYARQAPWTAQQTGIFRTAGTSYYRWAAYPATVACRYAEWVWQRPGRLAAHAALIKLLAHTGPGIWVVDHIVYPAAHLAGHILL